MNKFNSSFPCKLLLLYVFIIYVIQTLASETNQSTNNTFVINYKNDQEKMPLHSINCYSLKIGQFRCDSIIIDDFTQQPLGCAENNLAPINCTLINGLICDQQSKNLSLSTDDNEQPQRIQLLIPCQYTNGYSYEMTLILSIFFGMFGADRFYLGYPAIGLLKFCTLGFLFLGQFVDIILIAMQIVKPADGSNYVIKFFGPRLTIINSFDQQRFGLFDNIPFIYDENFNDTIFRTVIHSGFDLYFYPPPLSSFNYISVGLNESSLTSVAPAAHHTNL